MAAIAEQILKMDQGRSEPNARQRIESHVLQLIAVNDGESLPRGQPVLNPPDFTGGKSMVMNWAPRLMRRTFGYRSGKDKSATRLVLSYRPIIVQGVSFVLTIPPVRVL